MTTEVTITAKFRVYGETEAEITKRIRELQSELHSPIWTSEYVRDLVLFTWKDKTEDV